MSSCAYRARAEASVRSTSAELLSEVSSEASLTEASLTEASLTEASLTEASLTEASLVEALLTGVSSAALAAPS
ncbi:pentapeptide repeat-containing protein [Brevibacterium sp. NPDC049920]|uniref:pentapeptide repeat-containing protein n=1 Tax=Brevibacterium sp. NPDC049920 TaxID=3155279 RepID=UPI0033FD012E